MVIITASSSSKTLLMQFNDLSILTCYSFVPAFTLGGVINVWRLLVYFSEMVGYRAIVAAIVPKSHDNSEKSPISYPLLANEEFVHCQVSTKRCTCDGRRVCKDWPFHWAICRSLNRQKMLRIQGNLVLELPKEHSNLDIPLSPLPI